MTRTPLLLDARPPCRTWCGPLHSDGRQVRCTSCGRVVPTPSLALLYAVLAVLASVAACGLVVAAMKLGPMAMRWIHNAP
jgi:hypothetical protein